LFILGVSKLGIDLLEKPKPFAKRKKLPIVRERCERLVALQYPEREVSYETLKMTMMSKLELYDDKTILKYLGRPTTVKTRRIGQEVHYLKSGTVVSKEHKFTQVLERKKGYIEILGYAKMFWKNGKPYFRLFYENLINKPLLLFQECEGKARDEKFLSPLYEVKSVEKKHDSAEVYGDSKVINRKKRGECLIGRERNLVYKCKGNADSKNEDYALTFLDKLKEFSRKNAVKSNGC